MKRLSTYLIVIAAVGWSPLSLADGDTAVREESKFTRANLNAQVERNEAGEYQLEVLDIFYSGGEHDVRRVVDGVPLEVKGYLKPIAGKDPEQTKHRRMHLVQRSKSS